MILSEQRKLWISNYSVELYNFLTNNRNTVDFKDKLEQEVFAFTETLFGKYFEELTPQVAQITLDFISKLYVQTNIESAEFEHIDIENLLWQFVDDSVKSYSA